MPFHKIPIQSKLGQISVFYTVKYTTTVMKTEEATRSCSEISYSCSQRENCPYSGPYFLAFELNMDENNSKYGHILRSGCGDIFIF